MIGGFSSSVKSRCDMNLLAWSEEDSGEVSLFRISMFVFIFPLAWPFWEELSWPVAILRVGFERRFATFRFICVRPRCSCERVDLDCGKVGEGEVTGMLRRDRRVDLGRMQDRVLGEEGVHRGGRLCCLRFMRRD